MRSFFRAVATAATKPRTAPSAAAPAAAAGEPKRRNRALAASLPLPPITIGNTTLSPPTVAALHNRLYRRKEFSFAPGSKEEARAIMLRCITTAKLLNAVVKFEESFDVAVNTNVDKKLLHLLRGSVVLPHSTGKTVRVAVFADGVRAEEARAAGADFVGKEDLAESIKAGKIDFERCIATPDMMGVVAKVARVLGPRGLMPNPKLGTVTTDVSQAIKNAKGGQVTFKGDKGGTIHAAMGKFSFDNNILLDNIIAFLDAVTKARPVAEKKGNKVKQSGVFVRNIFLQTSFGRSIFVDGKVIEALRGRK